MVSLSQRIGMPSTMSKARDLIMDSLNFYRVHLIVFTVVPLISSAIMYGTSTEYHIPYIDCLFICMSCFTVTGLVTINISTLSAFQQSILFVLEVTGSLTFVSIIMIVVRLHFIRSSLKHVVEEQRKGRRSFNISKTISRVTPSAAPISALRKRFSSGDRAAGGKEQHEMKARALDDRISTSSTPESLRRKGSPQLRPEPVRLPSGRGHKMAKRKVTTSMIKRVEGGGVGLMNPSGWYDAERGGTPVGDDAPVFEEEQTVESPNIRSRLDSLRGDNATGPETVDVEDDDVEGDSEENGVESNHHERPIPLTESPLAVETHLSGNEKVPYAGRQLTDDAFPRSKTIAFDDADDVQHHVRGSTSQRDGGYFPRSAAARTFGDGRIPRSGTINELPRTATSGEFPRTHSLRPSASRIPDPKLSGFGGFPTPFELAGSLLGRVFPKTSRSLTQSFTLPRTTTIGGGETMAVDDGQAKKVPYISFSAVVGRNSRFTGLTDEQMDELGGVEYRALRVLMYTVIGYFLFMQLAAYIIIAPYIGAGGRYDFVFEGQARLVKTPWFALFLTVSAFVNNGMSLVDASMIPFQTAYLMVFIMCVLILGGNTAYPIFLRLTVWTTYKLVPATSRVSESLKFLLDHPRRCFVYLFPSTQTWVLAMVMLALTMTDWVSFLVLDLGTATITSIPVGRRMLSGLFQSLSVRSSGFGIVSLGSLAPAVQVLYVIMMYIAVYPIALSVRSTNVYEERSLGLYQEDETENMEETGRGVQAVARYLGWHARRQLAFDIWWLGFALWLVCIIERDHLDNGTDATWFNVFTIIFELVSAYGTVGLSLGVSYDNYSLSGGFRKLSKLVVIIVMLRGRHRGLPVAIDRAVMLPKDFSVAEEQAFEERSRRAASRRGSTGGSTGIPDEPSTAFRRGSMSGSAGSPEEPFHPLHRSSRSNMSSSRRESFIPQRREHDQTPPPLGRSSSAAAASTPSSPGALQFNLPRSSEEHQRSPVAMRSGALSPVVESSMSRAVTSTEEP